MNTETESVFEKLFAYTFARRDVGFIHQHALDAWVASAGSRTARPIQTFFALAGLYLLVDRQYSGRQVQAAHTHMARRKQEWPYFEVPKEIPTIIPADIMKAAQGEERDAAILRWCVTVWNAWEPEHPRLRSATDELLEGWSPPTP